MNIGELKNIDLKNIDVKEIFAKLKINDLFKDKKFVIKFSIYFFFYSCLSDCLLRNC